MIKAIKGDITKIVSVTFNLLFAALIDFISFRKIKDIPLTSVLV